MADVCPSHDDRLTEPTPGCPAVPTAARAQLASATTTASVGGRRTGAGLAAEV